jgi:hypothetical protein
MISGHCTHAFTLPFNAPGLETCHRWIVYLMRQTKEKELRLLFSITIFNWTRCLIIPYQLPIRTTTSSETNMHCIRQSGIRFGFAKRSSLGGYLWGWLPRSLLLLRLRFLRWNGKVIVAVTLSTNTGFRSVCWACSIRRLDKWWGIHIIDVKMMDNSFCDNLLPDYCKRSSPQH